MAEEPAAYSGTENRAYNSVAIPNLAGGAVLADVITKVNAVIQALRDAGIVKP